MANVISMDKRVAVVTALVEGCSIRSTVRMTGVSKGAILRLLESLGEACMEFHNTMVRNVQAKRVQVDEIWSFVGAKQKNVRRTTSMTAAMLATFGPSPRLRHKASWSLAGWLDRGTPGLLPRSFRTLKADWQTGFS
jgi:hypothetical protein